MFLYDAMRSSCKGQCETCCHVTDQSQMGEIEEVEAYCGWDGHIGETSELLRLWIRRRGGQGPTDIEK